MLFHPAAVHLGSGHHINMSAGTLATIGSSLIFLMSSASLAGPTSPSSTLPSTNSSAALALSAECDALIALAIRKPYGCGWSISPDDPSLHRARLIDAGPMATPAAGLLLLRAGLVLHEPKYVDAANRVALAMAFCQHGTGKIPDQLIFAEFPGGRDAAGARDRSSTCASMALLLEILQNQDLKDQRLIDAAVRAGTWLMQQQLRNGGWAAEVTGTDAAHHPVRVLRLDSTDWRDSTLALLLLGQVLKKQAATHRAQQAAAVLISLQLGQEVPFARGAWAPMYDLSANPVKGYNPAPYAIDTAATMHAAQTLLARYVLQDDDATADALVRVALTMKPLRRAGGHWYRVYGLPSSPGIAATRPTTTASPGEFIPLTPVIDESDALAPDGLEEILTRVEKINANREAFRAAIDATPHAQITADIARTICGLNDALPPKPAAGPKEDFARKLRRIDRLMHGLTSR